MPVSGMPLTRRVWLGTTLRASTALLGIALVAACGSAGATSEGATRATPPLAAPTATATSAPTAAPTSAPTAAPATARPSPSAVPSPAAGRGVPASAGCALPPLPGVFLGMDDRAVPGPQGASDQAQLIRFFPGQPARVLLQGLPPRNQGGLAASPDGRFIAFGRDQDRGPGNQDRPDAHGLWVMEANGSNARRLLTPPPSPVGNFLTIGPIAWAPDGKTLAYSVRPLGSGAACPDPMAGGVWLTAIAHPQPRRLATAAQLGATQPAPPAGAGCSLAIDRLSWSADGKTLAVSTLRPKPGAGGSGGLEPVVLAVDAGSGAAQSLVPGGADAAFAPASGRLAYVSSVAPMASTPAQSTLWAADPQGNQARRLVTQEALIQDIAWSPDGRFLAFLGNAAGPRRGWTLQVVDADGGTLCTVVTTQQFQQPPFLAGGALSGLAWASTGS